MILIWTPSTPVKVKQFYFISEDHLKQLHEHGYKVYRFDSARWTFELFQGEAGWQPVEPLMVEDLPKDYGPLA